MDFFYDKPLFIAINICLLLSFFVQSYYYLYVFTLRGLKNKKTVLTKSEGVSVVICAKNESENLQKLLPTLLEQDYEEFEIVVVNNCSTDDSDDVLKYLQTKYDKLQVRVLTPATISVTSKAVALGIGIKAARYNRIIITNAYCSVSSKDWIAAMAYNKADLVTSYTRSHGSLMFRADEFFNALFELGYALRGKAYTGNDSNACFSKDLFFDNKGFSPRVKENDKAEKIFYNSLCNSHSATAMVMAESVNDSYLSMNFEEWRRNKTQQIASQRLYSRGRYIKTPELISRILFYALLPVTACLAYQEPWCWTAISALFTLRLTMQVFIFIRTQSAFKEKKLLLFSLIWDVLSLLAYLPVMLSLLFRRNR